MFVHCECTFAFSALTLLVGHQEGHPACKKTEWWGAGMVICLDRGADLHTAQLMPLLLTVSFFSKIRIGFTFLVPAHLGSPGQRVVKWVCVMHCEVCQFWNSWRKKLSASHPADPGSQPVSGSGSDVAVNGEVCVYTASGRAVGCQFST